MKEKAVDTSLVADLVYHAAVRNLDHALVVTADQDFSRAISRVEDFGCTTTLCCPSDSIPTHLARVADTLFRLDIAVLRDRGLVVNMMEG